MGGCGNIEGGHGGGVRVGWWNFLSHPLAPFHLMPIHKDMLFTLIDMLFIPVFIPSTCTNL
jgi:hypothetical protein